MTGPQLIVALDAPLDRAIELYRMLRPLRSEGCSFKVGVPMLLDQHGQGVARSIVEDGGRLMLDLKLYDVHDSVLRTMVMVERLGAHMVTVHEDCVLHAIERRGVAAILSVRALTDDTGGDTPREFTEGMIAADGLICSVNTASALRSYTSNLLVCPGVRPEGADRDNHTLAATPRRAREAGADYVVVGRPIIDAPDPVGAARAIIAELAGDDPDR